MYPNKGADGPSNCLSVHTWRSEKLTLLAIKNYPSHGQRLSKPTSEWTPGPAFRDYHVDWVGLYMQLHAAHSPDDVISHSVHPGLKLPLWITWNNSWVFSLHRAMVQELPGVLFFSGWQRGKYGCFGATLPAFYSDWKCGFIIIIAVSVLLEEKTACICSWKCWLSLLFLLK